MKKTASDISQRKKLLIKIAVIFVVLAIIFLFFANAYLKSENTKHILEVQRELDLLKEVLETNLDCKKTFSNLNQTKIIRGNHPGCAPDIILFKHSEGNKTLTKKNNMIDSWKITPYCTKIGLIFRVLKIDTFPGQTADNQVSNTPSKFELFTEKPLCEKEYLDYIK